MFTKFALSWLSHSCIALGLLLAGCKSNGAPPREEADKGPAATAPTEVTPSIKIGVLAPFSGPFAGLGAQIEGGIKAYLQSHGDTVDGRKVELLVRDTTGVAPDVAKRLAQGLIVRDHVDFLAGFGLTPNAMAVAPLATESKTPMVIMNAATSSLTTKSPYIVRVSFTLPQVTAPLATWAAKNSIQRVYTLVSDYAPGADAEAQFKKTFEAAGGKVIDSVKVPVNNPDFAPFIQRIKDARPQAVFVFVPAGAQGIAFMKAFQERGLAREGIRIIATGDVTEDSALGAMGEEALGVVTTHHYSAAHPSAENAAFKVAFAQVVAGGLRPNFMAVGGYDGMAAIAAVIHATGGAGGKIDGDRAMQAFKGLELTSPRGPIRIDPETRDIVQTVYVRKVERREDGYYNVEFQEYPGQTDPGK
jgi:branched-chain amino acid transport system substrate-binding protein